VINAPLELRAGVGAEQQILCSHTLSLLVTYSSV
jgi:hypothetical protein